MRLPTSPRPAPTSRKRPTAARVRPSRAVRGLTFLATVVATLVLVGLSAFSVLLWWAPLVGVGAMVASFLWLRAGVQAEIRARKARRRPVRRTRPTAAAPAAAAAFTDRSSEFIDHAVGGDVEPAGATAVAADDVSVSGDGWKPVPVPPPTYTLKAKAEPRDAAAFAPPVDVEPVVAMADVVPGAAEDEARAAAYGT